MRKFLSFLSVLVIGFSSGASAQIEQYSFDTAHTQILFFVDHLGFSKSNGQFVDFDGRFIFDRTKPEDSSVNISIDAASVDMNHAAWDKHMKNEDFLNVEKFPKITFKSTNIEVKGDKIADIHGDLTILGVTKPVTLDVTHNKSAKHAFSGKYVSGFSAKANIKRSDFGMKYGLPLVGDDVEILIQVEGERIERPE